MGGAVHCCLQLYLYLHVHLVLTSSYYFSARDGLQKMLLALHPFMSCFMSHIVCCVAIQMIYSMLNSMEAFVKHN